MRSRLDRIELLHVVDGPMGNDEIFTKDQKKELNEMTDWLGKKYIKLTLTHKPHEIFIKIEAEVTTMSQAKIIETQMNLMMLRYDMNMPLEEHLTNLENSFDFVSA